MTWRLPKTDFSEEETTTQTTTEPTTTSTGQNSVTLKKIFSAEKLPDHFRGRNNDGHDHGADYDGHGDRHHDKLLFVELLLIVPFSATETSTAVEKKSIIRSGPLTR